MNLEILEGRRLLSVSVLQGYPGYYEVYGDDAADVIDISVSGADATFELDGVRYGGVAFISIYSGGGDDTVTVQIQGQTPIAAAVVGGDGNDTISLSGAGAIWGEGGDDTLRLTDAFRGEVYGGPGDDRIYVAGASADAEIAGEGGHDLIDATGCLYSVFATGGQGHDTLLGSNADDVLYGDAGHDLLIGYGGNDIFYVDDREHDRIIGGAGVDVAFADCDEAGIWGVEYVFYV